MSRNLLILGAGLYGLVAREIAESMGCFAQISFADDNAESAPDGTPVVGKIRSLAALSQQYDCAVVAIGNPAVRRMLQGKIEMETNMKAATLISPRAYVSPSAELGAGCILEPMAVVHPACTLGRGCLICAGAVVNHGSRCGDFV